MAGHWFPNAGEAVQSLKRRMAEQIVQERRLKVIGDRQLIRHRINHEERINIFPVDGIEKLERNRIWRKVFAYFTNSVDVESAYYACETFKNILEERMAMRMLPQIFQILRSTGYLNYFGIRGRPLTRRQLDDSREILKLRLVTKSWKKMVEQEFLEPLMFSQSQTIWHSAQEDWDGPMVCRFKNSRDIRKAIHKLKNPSSCASLIRLVELDDERCRNKDALYSKLEQFLDIHGKAVHGFFFYDGNYNYEILCEMLSRMPHLKMLKLKLSWNDDPGASEAWLRHNMELIPLPDLPELEFCHMDCVRNHPTLTLLVAEMSEMLNKYSLSVRGLWLGHWLFPDYDEIDTTYLVWEALRNLNLEYFELACRLVPDHIFAGEFNRLLQFQWPLKSLCISVHKMEFINDDIDYDDYDLEIVIDTSNFFAVLRRFNDTLVEFKYHAVNNSLSLRNDGRGIYLVLPNLKKIDIPEIRNSHD